MPSLDLGCLSKPLLHDSLPWFHNVIHKFNPMITGLTLYISFILVSRYYSTCSFIWFFFVLNIFLKSLDDQTYPISSKHFQVSIKTPLGPSISFFILAYAFCGRRYILLTKYPLLFLSFFNRIFILKFVRIFSPPFFF